jgi:hypothetical protein
MTATAQLFREVLADRLLTHSATDEAREIVVRAERAVERFKTDISQRDVQSAPVTLKSADSPLQGKR